MGRELVTNLSDLSVISGTPDGRRREMTSRSHFLTSTHTHNKVNVYQFINTKPLFILSNIWRWLHVIETTQKVYILIHNNAIKFVYLYFIHKSTRSQKGSLNFSIYMRCCLKTCPVLWPAQLFSLILGHISGCNPWNSLPSGVASDLQNSALLVSCFPLKGSLASWRASTFSAVELFL